MPQSFCSSLFHCVFSTKNRHRSITPELQDSLWPYLGGITRKNGMKALAVGGIEDHIHVLVSLPSTLDVAKAMQIIKGGSSKWVHDTFSDHRDFGWQAGYGAFSISVSQIDDTIDYINSQKDHHLNRTYQDEFLAFLKKHEIEYDPRYIWD